MKKNLAVYLLCGVVAAGVARADAGQTGATPDPDTSARLSAFDEAWRLVRDTHFDPSFNGVDWERIRTELRPKAAAARSDAELRAVIADMLGRLGQSHFYVLPGADTEAPRGPVGGRNEAPVAAPEAAQGDLGLELRAVEGRLTVWRLDPLGPAGRAGVRRGWSVEQIDGDVFAPGEIEKRPTQTLLLAATELSGTPGTTATVMFRDGDDRRIPLTLARRRLPGTAIRFGNLPAYVAALRSSRIPASGACNAGVIQFNVWMIPIAAEFDAAVDALRDCSGIVLDLRGNPGGVAAMAMGIAGHFVTKPRSLGTMKLRDAELRFVANPRSVTTEGRPVAPFGGPLAILVDSMSFSASEMFAGGMQAIQRARIFGERTAGAVLPALFDRLPNGDVLAHAFADFITPDGIRLEGRGVIPDVSIAPTRAALLRDRDSVLEAALHWIAGH